ncbi:MAG TPA: helix-turn-helix domain-containing protein [Actinomycetaceae bacterium]|nr:helix-turn-helix domain-containing protein [Actinomycetaceae bacterium]
MVKASTRRRGRPPETSHDEIRDIALKLFCEQGYARTSLAGIAEAAGISRTTLFTYFPSKRDMIWVDHDRRRADIDRALAQGPAHPVVDLIMRGLLAGASYTIAEHDVLATRWRIVENEDELRAYRALADQEMTRQIARSSADRAPGADAHLITLVTRALSAAASVSIGEWAAQQSPTADLYAHISTEIQPIVDALRPLLP